MTTEVTQADRLALDAMGDALGFLMDNERAIVLGALARHRAQALAQGRLDGVEAGLEAAAKEAEDFWGVDIAAPRIRALDPATIANQIGEK